MGFELYRRLSIQITTTAIINKSRPLGQINPPPELDHPATKQEEENTAVTNKKITFKTLPITYSQKGRGAANISSPSYNEQTSTPLSDKYSVPDSFSIPAQNIEHLHHCEDLPPSQCHRCEYLGHKAWLDLRGCLRRPMRL